MTAPPDDLPEAEALAAFLGPDFDARRFNWQAALVPMWLAYRKLVVAQILAAVLYSAVMINVFRWLDAQQLYDGFLYWVILLTPYALLGALEGAVAGRLLHLKARMTWSRVRRKNLPREAALAAMREAGGTSVGNTIAVPGLMAVAWILYSLFGGQHDHSKAYIAAMKGDLRNLVTAEEAYFADSLRYTASPDSTYLYYRSAGVTLTIGVATATGWNATATHNTIDLNQMCGIFVGTAPPPVEDAVEGEPKCVKHRH